MKLILFDIDGTLLATGGAGMLAFERAFNELFNLSAVWGDLRPDGKTDPVIIDEITLRVMKRKLTDDERQTLTRRYHEYFRMEINRATAFRLMPGVENALARLAARGDVRLGVATGNFEEAAWLKLEKGGLRQYFSFGGFGSDSSDRFELTRLALARGREAVGAPVPACDVSVIGDTPADILAGQRLGARTVAIATGRHSVSELAQHNPDRVLPDMRHLESVLEAFSLAPE